MSKTLSSNDNEVLEFLKALGIDYEKDYVKTVLIRIEAGEKVKVVTERYLRPEEIVWAKTKIEEFNITVKNKS